MVNVIKGNEVKGDFVNGDKNEVCGDMVNGDKYICNIGKVIINDECATGISDKFVGCDIFHKKSFNYVFPIDHVNIDAIFIEPNYYINNFDGYSIIEHKKCDRDFIQNAQKILNEQKLIVIYGPYGSGKTIVSKMISKTFSQMNYNILFFKFTDILQNYNFNLDIYQLQNEIFKYKETHNNILCVFDGYDEIHFVNDERFKKSVNVLNSILTLTKDEGIKVLINTRVNKGTEEAFSHKFMAQVADICDVQFLKMIELVNNYDRTKINEWINCYRIEKNSDIDVTVSLLESSYKKIYSSFGNPLFVYMICYMIYKNNNTNNVDSVYKIYECFVNNTAKGKFEFENTDGNMSLDKIIYKYRGFLTCLAMNIYRNSHINLDTDQILKNDIMLDLNHDIYEVNENSIQEDIYNIMSEIHNSDQEGERLKFNVLNCYFLERNSSKWRFKDNNIMYFLIAEAFYENIITIIINMQQSNSIDSFNIKSFGQYSQIKLHPIFLEMLFDKIRNDNQENKKLLMEGITFLLHKARY